MTAITERVAKGAALLDDQRPGWWQHIDLDRLDIDSCDACILGQVGGSRPGGYSDTLNELGLYNFCEDVEYGFDGDYPDDLTTAWRGLIEQRRELAGVAG